MKSKIEQVLDVMAEIKRTTKCGYDYDASSFMLSTRTVGMLYQSPEKEKILLSYFLNSYVKDLQIAFSVEAQKRFGAAQLLTVQYALAAHSGFAECGPLSSLLIMNLIRSGNFENIHRYEIDKGSQPNHAMVVVEDEQGEEWAFDPFFNFHCPLSEYWEREEVINYFKNQGKEFNLSDTFKNQCNLRKITYDKEIQQKILQNLEPQIRSLLDNPPDLSHLDSIYNIINSYNENNAFIMLKNLFIKGCIKKGLPESEATRNVNFFLQGIQSESNSNKITSSITRFSNIYQNPDLNNCSEIECRIKEIKGIKLTKSFFDLLKAGNYGLALRKICILSQPEALKIVELLFEFKESGQIDFNINEQGKESGRTALHNAAQNNQAIYEFLIQKNANPCIEDKEGITAENLNKEKMGLN